MKRHAFRILLCLVLGAVTTVGVAWGCALNERAFRIRDSLPTDVASAHLQQNWPGADYAAVIGELWARGFGLDFIIVSGSTTDGREVHSVWIDRSGLPLRSMSGETYSSQAIVGHGEGHVITAAALVSTTRWLLQRRFPLRPIWPGFLIDTFFYAGVWLALFFGFSTMRRAIRRRRGRCRVCGYDLRGAKHTACPECGAPAK